MKLLNTILAKCGLASISPAQRNGRRNEFAIGIFMGTSPFDLVHSDSPPNPVLTYKDVSDVRASFVADPFMVHVDATWYMFFEVMNLSNRKGEIGLALSENGTAWRYQEIILTESFHLSYPYVFQSEGVYYMIPETHKSSSVRLYRAKNFPYRWSFVQTLLSGGYFGDSSIFPHRNRWWMFSETNSEGKNDTLRLYFADKLTGPWHEHPKSPVIQGNPHIARPAGRVLVSADRILRFTQDCFPRYGMQVRAFEIVDLTTRSYEEKEVSDNPILGKGNAGAWNEAGMHHIDPHQVGENKWIACVDGHRKVSVADLDSASSNHTTNQNDDFFPR